MRGRVGAVHSVFIGSSNEMSAFESGIAAISLGTVGAIVSIDVGTGEVVLLIAGLRPEVRRLGRLAPTVRGITGHRQRLTSATITNTFVLR